MFVKGRLVTGDMLGCFVVLYVGLLPLTVVVVVRSGCDAVVLYVEVLCCAVADGRVAVDIG